jgi:hypothetical protein
VDCETPPSDYALPPGLDGAEATSLALADGAYVVTTESGSRRGYSFPSGPFDLPSGAGMLASAGIGHVCVARDAVKRREDLPPLRQQN